MSSLAAKIYDTQDTPFAEEADQLLKPVWKVIKGKASLLGDLEEGFHEIARYKAGQLQLRDATALIDEL